MSDLTRSSEFAPAVGGADGGAAAGGEVAGGEAGAAGDLLVPAPPQPAIARISRTALIALRRSSRAVRGGEERGGVSGFVMSTVERSDDWMTLRGLNESRRSEWVAEI